MFAPTCTPVMAGRQHLVTTTMLLQGMQSLYEHIIRTSPAGDISDQTLQVRLPGGHVRLCTGPVRSSESPVRLCEAQRQVVHYQL